MRKVVHGLVAALALAVCVGLSCPDFAAGQDKKKGKDVKTVGAATAVFELYKDSAGEFRFRLKEDDGALLATSGKGYKTKADCQKVIDTIRALAARAKVEDKTAVTTSK